MGMQVSFGEHTEISVPEPVRIAEKGYRQCVPWTGMAERVSDRGGVSDPRSFPHTSIHSIQKQGERGCRLHQRQELNLDCMHWDGCGRNFTAQSFMARGYYVSTVWRCEKLIRKYLRKHEEQDRRNDGQMNLPFEWASSLTVFRRLYINLFERQIKLSFCLW